MVIFRFLLNLLSVIGSAFVGNWIGGQIRYYLTGEQVQTIRFEFTTKKGRKMSNFPVTTKFYPALLISLLGKPRWLYALISGILTGVFVDDCLEEYVLERVIEPLVIDRVLNESET